MDAIWTDVLGSRNDRGGVRWMLERKTPDKLLKSRLLPAAERDLMFLLTEVDLAAAKRHQNWFAARYLLPALPALPVRPTDRGGSDSSYTHFVPSAFDARVLTLSKNASAAAGAVPQVSSSNHLVRSTCLAIVLLWDARGVRLPSPPSFLPGWRGCGWESGEGRLSSLIV